MKILEKKEITIFKFVNSRNHEQSNGDGEERSERSYLHE